jgi:phosphate transport system substrate-binding protein
MHYTNTRGAYKDIVDGKCDLIICVQPSDEQIAYAAENGVEFEMVPIGHDAFVFIVNSNNPVNGITTDQIRGIYSGQITNWSELGGKNMPIAAMHRNEGSGSQTALEKLMGDTPLVPDYTTLNGSPIGFSFRYYVTGMLAEGGVKMLAIDGVEPDIANIANGTYPVTSGIYAIYRKGETNENVYKAVDFMLSPEGQKIVEESGYVPVN